MSMDNRKIDALVAEHIMEWKWTVNISQGSPVRFLLNYTAKHLAAAKGDEAEEPMAQWSFPRYSTDWDAAMKVRDKVRTWDMERQTRFLIHLLGLAHRHYVATVANMLLYIQPIDICLAALKTLDIAVPEEGATV